MSPGNGSGQYSGAHVFSFSEKTRRERMEEFVRFLRGEISTFLATAVSLWAVAETIAAATGGRASLERLAVPVLVLALAVSCYRAYHKQSKYVPEVLSTENDRAKKIFRRQRCGWNAALAREMLLSRIAQDEAALDRLARGAEYVEPKRIELEQYLTWLQDRPKAMQRMSRVVMVLCTEDLPRTVGNVASETDLADLRSEVEALARVYRAALDMEVDTYRWTPPEQLSRVHALTVGWTDTIRGAVRQLCDILEQVSCIDRTALIAGSVPAPSFSIQVDAPAALDEFCRELEVASRSFNDGEDAT